MAENEIVLKKGTKVFIGNACVTLRHDVVVAFESLTTRDAVAETLAANSQVAYAEHRESLAHEIVAEREVEGQIGSVRIAVTYGIGGARAESILCPEGELTAEEQEAAASAAPSSGGIEHTGRGVLAGFQVGVVVREKGGNVKMTVVAVEGSQVKLNFFEGTELREAEFAADALEVVEPAG